MAVDPLDVQIDALRRRLNELRNRIDALRFEIFRWSSEMTNALFRDDTHYYRQLQHRVGQIHQELARLSNEYWQVDRELRRLQALKAMRRWPPEYWV